MLIVNVTLHDPLGTVTLECTLATPLLLESVTSAPPAGAPALSVTAPVEVCTPPTTVVGSSVSDERVTGVGAGDDGVQRGRVSNL